MGISWVIDLFSLQRIEPKKVVEALLESGAKYSPYEGYRAPPYVKEAKKTISQYKGKKGVERNGRIILYIDEKSIEKTSLEDAVKKLEKQGGWLTLFFKKVEFDVFFEGPPELEKRWHEQFVKDNPAIQVEKEYHEIPHSIRIYIDDVYFWRNNKYDVSFFKDDAYWKDDPTPIITEFLTFVATAAKPVYGMGNESEPSYRVKREYVLGLDLEKLTFPWIVFLGPELIEKISRKNILEAAKRERCHKRPPGASEERECYIIEIPDCGIIAAKDGGYDEHTLQDFFITKDYLKTTGNNR